MLRCAGVVVGPVGSGPAEEVTRGARCPVRSITEHLDGQTFAAPGVVIGVALGDGTGFLDGDGVCQECGQRVHDLVEIGVRQVVVDARPGACDRGNVDDHHLRPGVLKQAGGLEHRTEDTGLVVPVRVPGQQNQSLQVQHAEGLIDEPGAKAGVGFCAGTVVAHGYPGEGHGHQFEPLPVDRGQDGVTFDYTLGDYQGDLHVGRPVMGKRVDVCGKVVRETPSLDASGGYELDDSNNFSLLILDHPRF